jgi:hypothetical protein
MSEECAHAKVNSVKKGVYACRRPGPNISRKSSEELMRILELLRNTP